MASKSVQKRVTVQQSKAVVVTPLKGVVVGGWREKAAQSIESSKKQSAKLPQQSGNFLSFRGGSPTLGGAALKNPLPLVILAHSYERSYYSKAFQPDVLSAPDCYSYDGEAPHEKAKIPQSDACRGCRWDEFQSAQNGKGKGCKEGAKFAAIHADALESPEKIASAVIIQGRLSVLNSKAFRNYAGYFEEKNLPIWGAQTELEVTPDSKSQYAVRPTMGAVLPEDVLDVIATRVDEAEKLLTQPYPDFDEPQKGAPKKGEPMRKRKF